MDQVRHIFENLILLQHFIIIDTMSEQISNAISASAYNEWYLSNTHNPSITI